ncbi:MAG: hypothetical protein B7Z20_12455, partial [Sphingobium sp. 32-64-5]
GQLNETMVLQPVVNLSADGTSAFGRWRIFAMRGLHGASASWHEAAVHAEYVFEGEWKIARQWIEERVAVPCEGSWGRNPLDMLKTLPDPAFPPDGEAAPIGPQAGLPLPLLAPYAVPAGSLADRLGAAVDVEHLICHFGYLNDIRAWDDVAALFSAGGLLAYGPRGGYRGQDKIRAVLHTFGSPGLRANEIANRMQVQPIVHVSADGKEAAVRTRSIMQLNASGKPLFGDAVNEFRLVRDAGRWRIASLSILPTFLSDLDRGIVGGLLPLPGAGRDPVPDLPPQMTDPEPLAAFLPPFHYAHPVTGAPMGRIAGSAASGAAADSRMPGWQVEAGEDGELARLADTRALETLQRTYGYLVDKALWRDATDLFAEDGTLEIGGR